MIQGQFLSRHTRSNEICKFQTVIYTFDKVDLTKLSIALKIILFRTIIYTE